MQDEPTLDFMISPPSEVVDNEDELDFAPPADLDPEIAAMLRDTVVSHDNDSSFAHDNSSLHPLIYTLLPWSCLLFFYLHLLLCSYDALDYRIIPGLFS